MINLKRCISCSTLLIPVGTSEGNLFIHPFTKDCEHIDLIQSIQININLLDERLYKLHIEQFGKSEYTIETVFEAYDKLLKVHKAYDKLLKTHRHTLEVLSVCGRLLRLALRPTWEKIKDKLRKGYITYRPLKPQRLLKDKGMKQ